MMGRANNENKGRIVMYSFMTNTWTELPSIDPPRHSYNANMFIRNDGTRGILVFGGPAGGVQILDMETLAWSGGTDYPEV